MPDLPDSVCERVERATAVCTGLVCLDFLCIDDPKSAGLEESMS